MKFLMFIMVMCLGISSVMAVDNNAANNIIQVENKSAFKGLFYKIWTKFKTMSPKKERKIQAVTATAGIRGAETVSTILKPYWKDDKTANKQFMQQLEDFAQAQAMAEKGNLSEANSAFNGYIEKYPDSDLKPNAQFAQALTMAAMGKKSESVKSFNVFIQTNPDHPLVADAKAVMAELN